MTALAALADRPDLFDGSLGVLVQMRAIGSLLRWSAGQAAVDEAQARLWTLALSLEEVSPEKTAQALAEARQAVRDAMDAAKQDPADPAKQAELQQRLEELRQAIQKHIEALTEQARREGTEVPLDPNQPQMNARDLDRMAQRMEDAAKQGAQDGKMDEAERQMGEMEKLLEQLQNARPEHGEQREKRNAERRQQAGSSRARCRTWCSGKAGCWTGAGSAAMRRRRRRTGGRATRSRVTRRRAMRRRATRGRRTRRRRRPCGGRWVS